MPSRRRRSTAPRPRRAASSAPAASPRRCSRSLAISIQARIATRPGPAASPDHASTASWCRPRRRSRWARSDAIRWASHGAATAATDPRPGPAGSAALGRPGRPPKSGRACGDHHGTVAGASLAAALDADRGARRSQLPRGRGRRGSAPSPPRDRRAPPPAGVPAGTRGPDPRGHPAGAVRRASGVA